MTEVEYVTRVNLHGENGEFVTIYHAMYGPPGMPYPKIRTEAEKYALKRVPGGKAIGFHTERS